VIHPCRVACSSLPAVAGEILWEWPRTRGAKATPLRFISGRFLISFAGFVPEAQLKCQD